MRAKRLLFQQGHWKEHEQTRGCESSWGELSGLSDALWQGDNVVVFVFGASSLTNDDSSIRSLQAFLPKALWFGASSQGVIDGANVQDEAVSAVVVAFERSHVKLVSEQFSSPSEAHEYARVAAASLISHAPERAGPLAAVLVVSDGLGSQGEEIRKALQYELGEVPIAGGMAADGLSFKSTWVLHHAKPCTNAVALLGLYGEALRFGLGSDSGPIPFGPIRRVTEVEGTELLKLDDRPALDVYKDYLGPYAAQLPRSAALFPIGLRCKSPSGGYVTRAVRRIDEARKSLRLAGVAPIGAQVQLMRATNTQLINAASNAGILASRALGDAASASDIYSFVISCCGRRVMLGNRTDEDLESILAELPAGAFQSGFFSYGEFGTHPDGQPEFHNMTLCVAAMTEDE